MPRTFSIADPTTLTLGFQIHLIVIDNNGTIRVEIFHPADPDGTLTLISTDLSAGAQTNITNLVAAAITKYKNMRGYI